MNNNNENPVAGMSFSEYSQLSSVERKRLWNAGQAREKAMEQARRNAEPDKGENEKLLDQVEQHISTLKRRGVNTELFDRQAATLKADIAVDADLQARMNSDAGLLTQQTFADYRQYVQQHGGVDKVIEFDAAVERYWQTGGSGDANTPEWAETISVWVETRISVEKAATAAANAKQSEADQAQRQAALLQHDANQLAQTNESESTHGE